MATTTKLHRTLKFYEAAAGKKTVMAVSGAALWLFVVAHLLGNLQVFLGPTKLDEYGAALRSVPSVLWAARAGLAVMFAVHIIAALQLWALKKRARPVGYMKKVPTTSTWASRMMYWSGPILLAFLVYHLLDLTFGVVNPGYREGAVNDNLVRSFSQPLVAGFYMLAMAMLWAHLSHGIWSMVQTLGFGHPRYSPRIQAMARVVALLLAGGNIAIVAGVLLGILKTQ